MENIEFEIKQITSKPNGHVVEFKIKEEGFNLANGSYNFKISPTDIIGTLFPKIEEGIEDMKLGVRFEGYINEIKDNHFSLNIKVDINKETALKLLKHIDILDNSKKISTPTGSRGAFSLDIN